MTNRRILLAVVALLSTCAAIATFAQMRDGDVAVLGSSNSAAQTFYVSPSGSGVSEDASRPGHPNQTLPAICHGEIGAGDTVVFLDGTYLNSQLATNRDGYYGGGGSTGNEMFIRNANCGTAASPITLVAANRHKAIVKQDQTRWDDQGGFDIQDSSYIVIDGFRIMGGNNSNLRWESGVGFSRSHHVTARNNYITDVGGVGVGMAGSTHVTVDSNTIIGAANAHPFCTSGISFYLPSNSWGFQDGADGYSNHVINNRVIGTRSRPGCDADANNSNGIKSGDGNCIIMDLFVNSGYTSNTTRIAGNECIDNGGAGIHVFNSSNMVIENNTLLGNSQVFNYGEVSATCNQSTPMTNITIRNNILIPDNGKVTARVRDWTNRGCIREATFTGNVAIDATFSSTEFNAVDESVTSDPTRFACGSNNLQSVSPSQATFVNLSRNDSADFEPRPGSIILTLGCALGSTSGQATTPAPAEPQPSSTTTPPATTPPTTTGSSTPDPPATPSTTAPATTTTSSASPEFANEAARSEDRTASAPTSTTAINDSADTPGSASTNVGSTTTTIDEDRTGVTSPGTPDLALADRSTNTGPANPTTALDAEAASESQQRDGAASAESGTNPGGPAQDGGATTPAPERLASADAEMGDEHAEAALEVSDGQGSPGVRSSMLVVLALLSLAVVLTGSAHLRRQ